MPSTIYLKEIPDKILREIDKEQIDSKHRLGVKLNQSKAVIKMLRDYIRCREQNNFKSE